MRVYLSVLLLVVGVCLMYTCVGSMVPQKKQYPPKAVSAGASAVELAKAGREIFAGSCKQCHGLAGQGGTDRAPDVAGVAGRAVAAAKERAAATGKPYSAADYLAESLFNPGAYLVERSAGVKYGNIMSFKLEPTQTLAVLAYLQSLGGKPTVTADSDLWNKWAKTSLQTQKPSTAPKKVGPPEKVVTKYLCVGCHDMVGETIRLGPSLATIGSRMSPGDILMQILAPDTVMAKAPEGRPAYRKGTMKTALEGNGFYRDVGRQDLLKLVLWLAAKKGKPKGTE